jgi:hypothetical protein
VLDQEVHDYLNLTVIGHFAETEKPRIRVEISHRLERQLTHIISKYESQASTRSSVLEQYQKLRNVFSANEDLHQLGSGIRGYGFAIASITMLVAVIFASWSYMYRTTLVVRASQPFFLILICMGVFVLSSSIFPMAIDDGFASEEVCDKACMAVPWLISMGWSIIFSALYAKLRRVNLVISNAIAFRSIKVSEKDVMLPFAVLFTCNMILMTLWTILDPLVWNRIQTSPTESYGACVVGLKENASWKVIVCFISVLNGAALIGANIEAYKARNVDTGYGESTFIGLIMGSFLQVVAVGLPLFFLVNDNPTARFFLTSSMVFIMSMSVLLLLFVPKWLDLKRSRCREGDDNSSKGEIRGSGIDSVSLSAAEGRSRYYDVVWKERVKSLEIILHDAGIDPKPILRSANILDESDRLVAATTQSSRGRLSFTGLAIPVTMINRSSVDSSLVPVSEVDKEINASARGGECSQN